MIGAVACRLRCERGQSAAEYIGVVLVGVAIVAAIAASPIAGAVTRGIAGAICSVTPDGCDRPAAERDGASGGRGSAGPDSDGDGLSDEREAVLGTNPQERDSDADGVLDGQEALDATDPLAADTDSDGVADGDDPVPAERDVDGDGLSDGEELALGSDARRADSDGDGVADRDEYEQGTDPTRGVVAPTDENRHRPWERVGLSEDDWRRFEDAVLDEVNPDGIEGFLFGRPYIGVDLDENGEVALVQIQENGVGALVRVIAGAGRGGRSVTQAAVRAASRVPPLIAARLGRRGVLPAAGRVRRPPPPPPRPGTALGALDDLGRPTGASATITRDMLGSGSRAVREPPGFGGQAAGHARGHLIARQLGGSGRDPRNLVTLFQRPTNSPAMRGFENAVRAAVERGEVVRYTVQPIYRGSEAIPRAVTLTARGSGGLRLDVSVLNRGS